MSNVSNRKGIGNKMAKAGTKFCVGCGLPVYDVFFHGPVRKGRFEDTKFCECKTIDLPSLPATKPVAGVAEILSDRQKTHGDFKTQAMVSRKFKNVLQDSPNVRSLEADQVEALAMILTKISRIVCGNPNEPDHWKDIEGYARLVSMRLDKPSDVVKGYE